MKNLFTLFFACTLLVFTTNISAQLNSTNTNNLPAGTTPNLTKKTVSTDLSKIRTIRTGAISNSQLTEEIKENTIGRDATAIIYSNDTRNLPLNSNGNLVNPDGFEVNFVHPHAPDSTHWCWTPVPVTTDGNRDINCAFSVPCDNPANRDGANTATVKYFQLVWHVMRNGGASTNISQTTINNLMTELNADFAPHNMVFCANPANFYEDAANYNHDENTEEVTLKTAYNVTPTQVINIYVVGTMGPGGYARFPYDPMGGTSPTGGIVLNRGNCWVGSHTLAHEMGHVFGLEHTFAGVDERATCSNCYEKVRNVNGSSNATGVGTPLGGPYTNQGDREGDWCSDTNPHATNSYDCTNYTNPQQVCDLFAPANPPVNNHMSYSFCTSQFTAQQGRRMHCMVDSYLTSWTSYGGGICGALPPVADFVGSPTTWIDPATVTFTDLSAPAAIITTWTWNFNNAANPNATVTPATFVGQNPPPIVYDVTSGVCEVFEVSLTVSGPNGSDTETKTAYIEVCPPASDCSTLNTDWLTPAPTPTIYNGAFGYFTGVPNEGSALPQDPAGMYQQYFTPTPGTSVVGAVRVGLGVLTDPDDDMTFQVVVYEDDPGNPGFPNWIAGPVAFEAFSPTQLGIPGGLSFVEFWVPFECAPTIAGTTFHVGVEMFPGDATDELVLVSNANGQGGSPLTNTYNATFCASQDYNTNGMLCGYAAVNFDLLCYPMMGWWAPLPYASGFTETNVCDTTYATVFTGTFYDCNGTQSTQILNWTYTFSSNGTTISSATEVPALSMTYTTPGPDTLTITAINECGRADTTTWIIPYNLNATPATDFSMAQTNPVCLGTPINFTGQPNTGMYSYTWDFGNGTVIGPGNIPQSPAPAVGTFPSPTYTYPAIGTYYVDLTVSSYGLQPGGPPIFQEGFEVGWPGWTRRNGDALTPDPTMAALGFGTTAATSWLVLDVDGDGAMEATSTSWYTPPGTADDWFRTPLIAIPAVGKYGLFWTGESFSGTWPDGYEVRLRTGTVAVPNAANYPTVLFSTTGENAFETNHVVDLSPYAGQNISIAFRNNTFDGYMLLIDSIRVAPLSIACTANRRYLDFVEVVDCSVQPPVYTINANPTSGCVPLNVNFQSTLTGGAVATSFTWNFGDGGFAFVEDPGIHTYTTPGTYFVSLDVCNAGGCNTYYQTIIVDALPTTSNAGPDQNFCGGTTATLAGNVPATGTGAWTVIAGGGAVTTPGSANSGVTGLTPGANTFQWTITNGSCTSIDQVTININTPPNAGTNGSITLCSNSAPVNLFSSLGGTPSAGGTWSGPSALGGGSLGTYNPATAAPGVYTYTVTGVAPCANATATVTVTENAAPNAGTNGTITLCSNSAPVNLFSSLGGTPAAGGIWSGPSALGGGSLGTYNPATAAPGVYTYTVTGVAPCANATATVTVTENAAPNAGTNGSITLCSNSAPVNLFSSLGGTPAAGGTWSGPSALGGGSLGTYDPATATAGVYTYTVTGVAPCANATATVTVTENAAPNAGTNGSITLCSNSAPVNLFSSLGGTPAAGGTWSGPSALGGGSLGTYDPATATPGVYTYTVTGVAPCANATATVTVTENAAPNAGTNGTHNFCSTGAAANLFSDLGGTPQAGGTWSGPSALGGGSLGTFNPATNTAGVYTYTVTAAGCANATATVTTTIETAPNAGTNNTLNICASSAPVNLFSSLGGTPQNGGTWSGPSALAGGDLGTFDPAINAAGVYTYTVTGTICPNATATITVNLTAAPDPGTNGTHSFCSSDAAANLFSDLGGTPQNGGVWTGPSALAGGDLGTFNPATNVAGTYTYTVTVAGCGSASADVVVTLETAPNAGTNGNITYCDAGPGGDLFTVLGGTPQAGGIWSPALTSGTGVFDPAVDPAGVYTYTVSGTICPNATATVTVTIETSPDAGTNGTHSYCSSDASSDLFADLGGTPQAGGTWSPALTSGTGVFDPAVDPAGVYTYTVSGTVCANAAATVTVSVSTAPDAGINNNFSICATGAPTDLFTQLGGTPDAGGTWSPALTSGTGVFDPAVDPAGVYTYTVTGIAPCANASATVTVTITANDDPSFVYPDFCAGSGGIPTSTVTPGGTWAFNPNPADGSSINAATGAITGEVGGSTYMVEYTTPAGPCQSSAINAVNIGIPANAGTNGTHSFCSNDAAADLFADIGGTPQAGGTWTPVLTSGTGVFDPAVDAAGTYTYIVTGTNGCVNDSSDVAVTIETAPDAGTNGTLNICASGAPVDLFTLLGGTPMAGGTWSPALTSGTGVFDPASDAAGVYTYTVSGTVCPNATATVTVTITASDDPTFAFADYCAGSANGPTGIVTPGGTFTFNPVPGDGATINASTGVITNGVGGNSYTIQYTTPAGPCQDSSTVNITVGVSANAGTNGNTTLCSSAAIVDLFTLLGGTPGASGTWSGPSALGGGSLGTFDPATNTAGTYDYLVTGTNGCVNDTASVTVNIDVSPGTANAGSDQTICNTVTTATLNGNIPSAGTGVWIVITGGGTVTTPASSSSGVTNLSNGTNQFVWTISNGICPSDADTVTVLLQSCTSTAIEIPTGFTPDGDGSNDTWVIPNINLYPDVRVEIFNRWGGLLFASDGYATPWDGKYEGENMPVGSYYFVIDLKDGTPAYKGTVTIIR